MGAYESDDTAEKYLSPIRANSPESRMLMISGLTRKRRLSSARKANTCGSSRSAGDTATSGEGVEVDQPGGKRAAVNAEAWKIETGLMPHRRGHVVAVVARWAHARNLDTGLERLSWLLNRDLLQPAAAHRVRIGSRRR